MPYHADRARGRHSGGGSGETSDNDSELRREEVTQWERKAGILRCSGSVCGAVCVYGCVVRGSSEGRGKIIPRRMGE